MFIKLLIAVVTNAVVATLVVLFPADWVVAVTELEFKVTFCISLDALITVVAPTPYPFVDHIKLLTSNFPLITTFPPA